MSRQTSELHFTRLLITSICISVVHSTLYTPLNTPQFQVTSGTGVFSHQVGVSYVFSQFCPCCSSCFYFCQVLNLYTHRLHPAYEESQKYIFLWWNLCSAGLPLRPRQDADFTGLAFTRDLTQEWYDKILLNMKKEAYAFGEPNEFCMNKLQGLCRPSASPAESHSYVLVANPLKDAKAAQIGYPTNSPYSITPRGGERPIDHLNTSLPNRITVIHFSLATHEDYDCCSPENGYLYGHKQKRSYLSQAATLRCGAIEPGRLGTSGLCLCGPWSLFCITTPTIFR